MPLHSSTTIALLAAGLSFAALAPAMADRGHHRHGRFVEFGAQVSAGTQVQATAGGGVNVTQNGNGNASGVITAAGGGAVNVTQNGNNNSVTVIQVTGGRGNRGRAVGRYRNH
jgi:L-2-hydroxyglutarate oxidase LhgO